MLTLLASLALAVLPTTTSPAGASVTCADAPATCEPARFAAAVPTTTVAQDADGAPADPPEYATPAEVDCPTPPGEVASSECDSPTPLYRWYGFSRVTDGDATNPSLSAAPRRARAVAVFSGAPSQPAQMLLRATAQPLALFALPGLVAASRTGVNLPIDSHLLPARALAPPDRPPRA
jgi:hypothetical protein